MEAGVHICPQWEMAGILISTCKYLLRNLGIKNLLLNLQLSKFLHIDKKDVCNNPTDFVWEMKRVIEKNKSAQT